MNIKGIAPMHQLNLTPTSRHPRTLEFMAACWGRRKRNAYY